MVARQADGSVLPRQFDTGVRLGAVADEVAQTPQLGRLARSDGVQRGLEGVPVGMDV